MKISKNSYGQYSSNNYSAHTIVISIDDLDLYFSYNTVIAFRYQGRLTVIKNQWGSTTGKHLNWINPDKSIRVDPEVFNQELNKIYVLRDIQIGD